LLDVIQNEGLFLLIHTFTDGGGGVGGKGPTLTILGADCCFTR